MSLYRSARSRLAQVAKSRLGRRYPDTFGMRRFRHLLDDYEVADLIEVDGKVPLNYFTYTPNFGDLLSPWLVEQMTGREVVLADRNEPHYVVIGSIVNQGTDQSILWGTGTYGTEARPEAAANARYTAVRGPLTRAKLSASWGFNINVPEVYGDPALLLPLYYMPDVPVTHEYGVAVRWSERRWAEATYGPGVKLIDFSRTDVEDVVREMLSCRRIITSSLHGLIVADAYGIPSAWLASDSPRGGVYKFYDYFASVQKFRAPQPLELDADQVTVERLRDSLTFSPEAIRFDYRPLLDASPFLRRKEPVRPRAARARPAKEPGQGLGSAPGTDALLPTLGYFGGVAVNYLSVRTEGRVSEVTLFLPKTEGQLDVRGIGLYNKGRRVVVDEGKVTYQQSSDALRTPGRPSPFALGGVRTEREPGAWWTVRLDAPVDADEVRVFNRLDGWGRRSRKLTVAVAGQSGGFRTVRSVNSDRVVEETLALLSRLTDREVDASVLDSKESAGTARRELLAELARRAGDGLLTADREEQRLLFSLVRTDRLRADEALTDDEWTLLGHLLAAERLRVPATKTSMRSLQFVLRTRGELESLIEGVNRAGEVLGTPRAVLTRHGIVDVGGLRARSEDYLRTIERAGELLESCGYTAMLAYGTLLGAVREGDFLAHDDDVDLMVPLEAAGREDGEPALARLREKLKGQGWRVTRPNSYTNFHLHDPETKLHVDVFPLFVDAGTTTLHMEKMRLRQIDTDIVMPPARLSFRGHELWGPARPEAFLAERYGEGWSVADPYYDWPWKLRDDQPDEQQPAGRTGAA
ncbi:polysaccharide pyruvyl transferase family protein [Isoptericola sp. BMS4]|uniref:polysaccharide pyruvyl transferase family protein n=1 Tax=Isoptericola sp. BMS4 TaxID=2527875 RepID=UPI00141F6C23|nr:polysaccharide pyruvyl transferase family protein [Isoptericola sp. BMS4]